MAGTVTAVSTVHRPRGVVRTDCVMTTDASGVVTASTVGVGYGRLVGVLFNGGSLNCGNAIISVTDTKTGAAIFTYDTDLLVYTATIGTMTGDDTGGATEDLFTSQNNHNFAAGDLISIKSVSAGAGTTLAAGQKYYIGTSGLAAKTFSLSTVSTGATLFEIGTDDTTTDDVSAMVIDLLSTAAGGVVAANKLFWRPSEVIMDSAGTAVSPATSAENTNRDIIVAGKVNVAVAQGGVTGTGTISFIVDEVGLADPALTV